MLNKLNSILCRKVFKTTFVVFMSICLVNQVIHDNVHYRHEANYASSSTCNQLKTISSNEKNTWNDTNRKHDWLPNPDCHGHCRFHLHHAGQLQDQPRTHLPPCRWHRLHTLRHFQVSLYPQVYSNFTSFLSSLLLSRYSMLMSCKCCKPCLKLLGRGTTKRAVKMMAWEIFWNMGILIWGTIDVTGKKMISGSSMSLTKLSFLAGFNSIGRVQSHDPTRDDYCHRVPYAFAFVLIIIGWLTYGIIGVFFCCGESHFLCNKYKRKGCCGKMKNRAATGPPGAGIGGYSDSDSDDAAQILDLHPPRRQPPKWEDWPPPPSYEDAAGINPAADDPVIDMPGTRDRDLEMAPVID